MPQARNAHQPRSDSNTDKRSRSQQDHAQPYQRGEAKHPGDEQYQGDEPRTKRPFFPMFGEKNSSSLWFFGGLAQVVKNRTQVDEVS